MCPTLDPIVNNAPKEAQVPQFNKKETIDVVLNSKEFEEKVAALPKGTKLYKHNLYLLTGFHAGLIYSIITTSATVLTFSDVVSLVKNKNFIGLLFDDEYSASSTDSIKSGHLVAGKDGLNGKLYSAVCYVDASTNVITNNYYELEELESDTVTEL